MKVDIGSDNTNLRMRFGCYFEHVETLDNNNKSLPSNLWDGKLIPPPARKVPTSDRSFRASVRITRVGGPASLRDRPPLRRVWNAFSAGIGWKARRGSIAR